MKTTVSRMLIVLLVLSSILTMAASPNNQRIKITPFTGDEAVFSVPDPNPGITKFVDGKTIVKGFVVVFEDTTSDLRVSGFVTATINYVYDGPPIFGTGPLWGTEHIINDGGGWDVRFTGYQYDNSHVVIHGHGSGEGGYEGLKAVWEIQSDNSGLTATVSGYIIEHE